MRIRRRRRELRRGIMQILYVLLLRSLLKRIRRR